MGEQTNPEAPAPIPVRGRYYLTECEYCGWVGSSEQCGGSCGPDDDDVICPVCCSSICGDSPDEADTAKHGEAVYQRIVTAEASLATATSELARLRAALQEIAKETEMGLAPYEPNPGTQAFEWRTRPTRPAQIALDALAARAATAREGA